MGCGGSTAASQPAEGKKGNSEKYNAEEKPAPKAKPAPEQEKKAPAPAPVQNEPAAPPPQKIDKPSNDGPALSPVHGDGGSTTSSGRDKSMPGPIMAHCSLTDVKDSVCLVSAQGTNGDLSGLTVAVYNAQTQTAAANVMDDDALTKVRDGLCSPPLAWPTFWKIFASAMSKADVKVNKDCTEVEVRMKQSKGEPKEVLLKLKLEPSNDIFGLFVQTAPRIFAQKRALMDEEAKEEKKDDKKLRESDIAKKEADYNLHESVLIASAEAEVLVEPRVDQLRKEAKQALREIGATQGGIAKTRQELETLESGAPSHPLDTMYGCELPALPEPTAIDGSTLNWDTDVSSLSAPLCDVALCLFEKHGLIDTFSMDKNIVRNFFNGVEARCHEVPFHGKKRASDCIIVMDHILLQLEKTVKFTKEDILAALLSAAILDLDHEGYDDCYVKRAGSMLSMLYSDVYSINQNNLTVAAEMFYNEQMNLLVSLTPDQNKDVIETVREALFIKANVQMKPPIERLSDFKQLVASGSADWGNKDNVRHAITHAVRMTDWSAWGRREEIHQELMRMVADEYYRQGDKELSLGLAPSSFHGTIWTTDRSAHDSTFAKGQVQFIDEVVLPLFEEMSKLAAGLAPAVDTLKANREAFVKDGGSVGDLKGALEKLPKLFSSTSDGTILARIGPDRMSLWVTLVCRNGMSFSQCFDDTMLAKRGVSDAEKFIEQLTTTCKESAAVTQVGADSASLNISGVQLDMPKADPSALTLQMMPSIKSFLELRGLSAMRYVDRKVEEVSSKAALVGNKAGDLKGEEKALKGCVAESEKRLAELKSTYRTLTDELVSKGRPEVTIEIEDALAISVRNPLKAPLPPGVTVAPDMKDVDTEVLKIIKSKFFTKEQGAENDLTEMPGDDCMYCNSIKPYLTSDFCKVTSSIDDPKRQKIWDLLLKMDDWDYDVFDLQTVMSGGIAGENLRNQPEGGALFITAYALMYKWQFMQKFNIDETVLINWLSIVEAGYHPNPYHNSMHAADVLHVTHYILGPGGCKEKVKATDEEIFAAIFAAAVHDYNHPGINNAFHVRSQNYLAVLFNDRSVNENIHASSIFELMRMDKFNILNAFTGSAYTKMRDDIVEFILGTDMGLHAMILSRFKKRLETTDGKMHKLKSDKNLAITMCVKMADINNCGRPQKLYHGWCNVIVDEFFQQGDRERLAGLPVSPFMDRFTTVMAKGQIGFMNYIVMPLFECMGEFLEQMGKASTLAEENKGFWQENEDW